MRSLVGEPEGECIGVRSHGDCKKMRIAHAIVDRVAEFSPRMHCHEVRDFGRGPPQVFQPFGAQHPVEIIGFQGTI